MSTANIYIQRRPHRSRGIDQILESLFLLIKRFTSLTIHTRRMSFPFPLSELRIRNIQRRLIWIFSLSSPPRTADVGKHSRNAIQSSPCVLSGHHSKSSRVLQTRETKNIYPANQNRGIESFPYFSFSFPGFTQSVARKGGNRKSIAAVRPIPPHPKSAVNSKRYCH